MKKSGFLCSTNTCRILRNLISHWELASSGPILFSVRKTTGARIIAIEQRLYSIVKSAFLLYTGADLRV